MGSNETAMSATLPPSLSALPEKWIERIFQRLEDFYGAKWAAQYGAFPRGRVMGTWAEELAGFADQPNCIGYALKNLGPFPPTLPEFVALCRAAPKPNQDPLVALSHKLTAADHERAQAAAQSALSGMKQKLRDGIDRHWATHPRSPRQLRMVFDAAKNDARLAPCIAEMVEKGICTESGALLKAYRDGEFFRWNERAAA